MGPTADNNRTAANFEFERNEERVRSEMCSELPTSEKTMEALTKRLEEKEEKTNNEICEMNGNSSCPQTDHNKFVERRLTINSVGKNQDGTQQENNGLLPAKTHEQKTVAPDGGWGWVVLAGCVYSTMMVTSVAMCFSIEFGQLMKSFNMSATAISWAFNLHTLTWSLMMPVTAPLCRSLGWRKTGLFSSLLTAFSYVALAFAFSPVFIFFFFGFLFSVAVGITNNITLLILPAYFEKHRGLALGINVTGVAIGQFVMPQVVRILQAEFGFRGGTLLHAGLFLNICVATALFRPLETYPAQLEQDPPMSPPAATKEIRLIRELNKKELSLGVSSQSLNMIPIETKEISPKLSKENNILREILNGIVCNVKSSASSLKSFKVLINSIGFAFFIVGYVNFVMLVPFAMTTEGHSLEYAAWCMSGSALSNFFTRLTMAFLVDRTWFRIKWTYMAGSVIASFFCFCFTFFISSVKWAMVCMVGWGLGMGIIMALWVMLLIETVGLDKYVYAMGAISLVMSVSYATAGPLFGVIRDASSSYTGSLCACAALQLSTALLWLLMPCAQRADLRRETRREKEAQKDTL